MPPQPLNPEAISIIKSWHMMEKESSYQPHPETHIKGYIGGATWNEVFWRTLSGDTVYERVSHLSIEERLLVVGAIFRRWWSNVLISDWDEILKRDSLTKFDEVFNGKLWDEDSS